jgi:hypothetical protein
MRWEKLAGTLDFAQHGKCSEFYFEIGRSDPGVKGSF